MRTGSIRFASMMLNRSWQNSTGPQDGQMNKSWKNINSRWNWPNTKYRLLRQLQVRQETPCIIMIISGLPCIRARGGVPRNLTIRNSWNNWEGSLAVYTVSEPARHLHSGQH